jgi:hypothetical protein
LWRLPYTEVLVCHKQRVEVFPFESVLRTVLGSLSLLGLVILDGVHISCCRGGFHPLQREVVAVRLPEKFKMPNIPTYTGSGDPVEHLDNFRAYLESHATPDEVACRVFPLTMAGNARDWFRELPPRSISTFGDLERMFLTQFMVGIVHKKPAGSLMSVC